MTAKIITNYFCFWRADSGNSSFVNLAPKTIFCFSREIELVNYFSFSSSVQEFSSATTDSSAADVDFWRANFGFFF